MKALGKIRRSERRQEAAATRWTKSWETPKAAPLPPRPSKARASFTYAAAMANMQRGKPKALLLKRERLEHGWTRRQYDYIRHCDRLDWPVSIARLGELT